MLDEGDDQKCIYTVELELRFQREPLSFSEYIAFYQLYPLKDEWSLLLILTVGKVSRKWLLLFGISFMLESFLAFLAFHHSNSVLLNSLYSVGSEMTHFEGGHSLREYKWLDRRERERGIFQSNQNLILLCAVFLLVDMGRANEEYSNRIPCSNWSLKVDFN